MTLKEEYARERKRVLQFVRRAEKRGYIFPETVIPKIPKRIRRESINALQRLTPDRLYSKAHYVSPETGEYMSGTRGRKEERKEKAAARARKKRQEAIWKSQQEIKERQKARINESISSGRGLGTGSLPLASKTIIHNVADGLKLLGDIRSAIDSWTPEAHWNDSLRAAKEWDRNAIGSILVSAIDQFGEKVVASRLQKQSINVAELIEEILYASGARQGNFKDGRTQVNADINRFATIVKGGTLSAEESIQLTEQSEDFEFDE